MPLVRKPTYQYTVFPTIDDMMSLLCGCPISWCSEPRINSFEITELNSLYLRITCHNIFPFPMFILFPLSDVLSFMLSLLMVLCVFHPCL